MQHRLIQRYLGNKAPIVSEIVKEIQLLAEPGAHVFDAFAGSLAVSASLKDAGYRVSFNDINHFTWLFGKAYFSQASLPKAPLGACKLVDGTDESWAQAIAHLVSEGLEDIPPAYRRTDIFDHYCEEGKKSAFVSKRGSEGRRRFFSSENAILIDRALGRIRYWHRECGLPSETRCLLASVLISAVEKVSNTQGTYHDFPREFIDSRALRTINLIPPSAKDFSGQLSVSYGKKRDTLDFVSEVPHHSVIYIDPPYNFRQYTSYYFMLNMLSENAEIDDLDDFFARIEFVRGQNMDDDFKSSFCSRKDFIPSLRKLISTASCDHVVLSYFDGRNHWGEFKSDSRDVSGRAELETLFRSQLFEPDSCRVIPLDRLNYQSYGGFAASRVSEFLFIGKKSTVLRERADSETHPWTGKDTKTQTDCVTG